MVVDGFRWFLVVLGGFRSFHVLVTTYKQTCSRQTTKKERLNALMLLNKNLLWPSQMENVNRNNV